MKDSLPFLASNFFMKKKLTVKNLMQDYIQLLFTSTSTTAMLYYFSFH